MHDKSGRLRKNSEEAIEVLHHLQRKIADRADEVALVKTDIEEGATALVLSYGITSRTAREAVIRARREHRRVSWLNVLSLFPIPEKRIQAALKGVQKVIVPEENLTGQYRSVIGHLLSGKAVVSVNRVGRMITPDEILKEIE
jgi:2-oxoglutarate ferredoxin oxidoreductase subunit alpha